MPRDNNPDESRRLAAASPHLIDTTTASVSLPLPKPFSVPKPKTTLPPSPHPDRKWNTADLPWRIASDITAAACASGLVARLITIIDRGIIENASNRRPLRASILSSLSTLLTRPHHFLRSRPFFLITALYFGTYLSANTIDTMHATMYNRPAQTITSGPAKFLATSSVNMTLCLYKDSQFARLFGPLGGAPRPRIPGASYLLFAARDSLTIFASFNLPPLIAPYLPLASSSSSSSSSVDFDLEKHVSRAAAAQFLAPAGIQLFSTPLHLLGLDLYNRSGGGVGWRGRLRKVGRDWVGSSFARMARIVPAFGVGGVVNGSVRRRMMMGVGG